LRSKRRRRRRRILFLRGQAEKEILKNMIIKNATMVIVAFLIVDLPKNICYTFFV